MKLSIAVIFVAVPTLWAADLVPMDVKTGQWETTTTTQITGMPQQAHQMPQLTPEQLAQIPPEQRARIQAMMAQMSGGAPRTTTTKYCAKKEDLTKLPLNNEPSCKTNVVSSSSRKQVIQVDCDRNGRKQTGTMTIEALGPESMKFTVVASGGEGKAANMSMSISGTSKWLGPVCSDAK